MEPDPNPSTRSQFRLKMVLRLVGIVLGSLAASIFLAPGLLLLGLIAMGFAGYLAWTHHDQSKSVALVAAAVLIGVAPWWIIGVFAGNGY